MADRVWELVDDLDKLVEWKSIHEWNIKGSICFVIVKEPTWIVEEG